MNAENNFQLTVEFDPLELHGAVISIKNDSGFEHSYRREAIDQN